MSSIFDKLKSAVGFSSSATTTGPGRRLGGGPSTDESSKPKAPQQPAVAIPITTDYSLTFCENSIGLQLESDNNVSTPPVVKNVINGSEAHRQGVLAGDLIVAIEGNPIISYDDFINIVTALGKPVTISFRRPPPSEVKRHGILAAASALRSRARGGGPQAGPAGDGTFKSIVPGLQPTATAPASAPALNDDERERRRLAMIQAAQEREKSWDKKIGSAKSKRKDTEGREIDLNGRPTFDHSALAELGDQNPETQRMVMLAKQKEESTIRAMGYNPFKPHMSSSGNTPGVGVLAGPPLAGPSASGATGAPSSFPAPGLPSNGGGSAPPRASSSSTTSASASATTNAPAAATGYEYDDLSSDLAAGEDIEGLVESVDEALGLLLSVAAEDPVQAQTAINTIGKMLRTLRDNETEPKFRSIRVLNGAFQSKVASVSGGIELMVAAGFNIEEGDAELQQQQLIQVSEAETFLRHPMGTMEKCKLKYTIARLQELQT